MSEFYDSGDTLVNSSFSGTPPLPPRHKDYWSVATQCVVGSGLRPEFKQYYEFSPTKELHRFVPQIYSRENDSAFTFVAELPGVSREGLSLVADKGYLRLSARTTNPLVHDDERLLPALESYWPGVDLNISLPQDIDADHISTHFEHGMLLITFPKKVCREPKVISVE
ncbi:hypothetical protein EV182_001189 [Spiromyces aspiralis]|uniref:Uncharacterized protein n=1 Tax=Spiromyces aspiralis TaxID=68401 RepID=A0ACC1HJC0_9FUNG|nr:hypothetical protein EV182_001189 [Spiromyces aspiralis]